MIERVLERMLSWRRAQVIALLGTIALGLTCTLSSSSQAGATNQVVARTARTTTCNTACQVIGDANWILQNQSPEGWIGMAPPVTTRGLLVQPYDAAYAALGLADAYGLTSDPSYAAGAWAWLAWDKTAMRANAPTTPSQQASCAHLDGLSQEGPGHTISCFYATDQCANLARGQIFFPYGPGDPRSCTGVAGSDLAPIVERYPNSSATHPYVDSTDATAAMFLVALNATYQATHNVAALDSLDAGALAPATDVVDEAVLAIHSTLDADGETWASPWWPASWNYPHKYLEDNAEAYAGLRAAAALEGDAAATEPNSLGHNAPAVAAQATSMANGIATAFNTGQWDRATPGGPAFDWAKDQHGFTASTNWTSSVYADPQENLWAVIWGLAPGATVNQVMSTFNLHFGPSTVGASSLWHLGTVNGAYPAPLYWVSVAESQIGDRADAAASLSDLNAAYAARIWQYQPKDAGLAIWAETGGP